MANNKVSSLFNVDFPKPKRSNFNLGRVNRFSADVGWLIPCYTEEILPNSYKRLDLEALIQTNATVAPLMGSFKVKVDAFFVPRRLYHQHLDMNDSRPNFSDDFDYHYITIGSDNNYNVVVELTNNIIPAQPLPDAYCHPFTFQTFPEGEEFGFTAKTSLKVAPGSLFDYLGMLPVGFTPHSWSDTRRIDALPFIGYYDIFRNYYINPHDPLVPFRVRNFTDANYTDVTLLDIGADRYVDATSFDKFIRSITVQSISADLRPVAVDALQTFNLNMLFHDAHGRHPYSFPPQYAGQLTNSGVTNSLGTRALDTRDGRHFGLLRRTYMDDYFNSRFMNSFVSYMEEQSTVQVKDNLTFTVTQLRLANRIAKYVDKSIFSDTRFGSWIKAHFGIKTNQKLCIPQFLGSISSNIVFSDIRSTAQTGNGDITSNQALGSRASLGQGYIKNNGSFVEFQASEPGVLMCIFSITPYVSYFQGIKKMYLKTSFADMYMPEFDAVGYDDIQKLEFSAVPDYVQVYGNTINAPQRSFEEYNVSLGKHPAWVEYMTATDECHGLMAEKYQYGFWLLNRPFSPYSYDPQLSDGDNMPDFDGDDIILKPLSVGVFENSTYINPEYFNAIFAVDKWTDNFQVQIRWFDKTKQPISKQILPHL